MNIIGNVTVPMRCANIYLSQPVAPNGATMPANHIPVLARGTESPLTARTLKAAPNRPTPVLVTPYFPPIIAICSFIMSDTPIPDDLFQHRTTAGGVYSSCFDRFLTGEESLSQLEFPADFNGVTEPWDFAPNTFTTNFTHPQDETTEFSVTLFGEVLDEIEGTALGATGSSKRGRVSHFTLDHHYVVLLT